MDWSGSSVSQNKSGGFDVSSLMNLIGGAASITPAGAAVGAGMGAFQTIMGFIDKANANKAFKKAESLIPEESDIPAVSLALLRSKQKFDRQSKAISTGVEYKNTIDTLRNIASGGARNVLSQGGGGMGLYNRMLGRTINEALGQTMDQQKFYETLGIKTQEQIDQQNWQRYEALTKILEAKRNLQLMKSAQLSGQSATGISQGFDNLASGIVSMLGNMKSGGQNGGQISGQIGDGSGSDGSTLEQIQNSLPKWFIGLKKS
jgi:hypothetical protein